MERLGDDRRFIKLASRHARRAGLVRQPRFDADALQLVEGELRLDLVNVWHRWLHGPEGKTAAIKSWLWPEHLGRACYFGRVDLVEAAIREGRPLDGSDYGGDPIAAACEAWVTTPLHVRCIELLYGAGAPFREVQLQSFWIEACGSEIDNQIYAILRARADH